MKRLTRSQLAAIALKAQGIYSYGHSTVIMPPKVKHLTPDVIQQRENFGKSVYNYANYMRAGRLSPRPIWAKPKNPEEQIVGWGRVERIERSPEELVLLQRKIDEHTKKKDQRPDPHIGWKSVSAGKKKKDREAIRRLLARSDRLKKLKADFPSWFD